MREMEYPSYSAGSAGPRLNWSAVLAGSAVTLAALACLNVLGVGLNLLPAAASADGAIPAATAGPGVIWWPSLSGIGSFYLGGWIASRLCDSGRRADGVIFGIVSWAVSTLATVYVPAFALGGTLSIAASGATAFATMALEAAAAALGGSAGARLYLPVPVDQFRRTHPHPARTHKTTA